MEPLLDADELLLLCDELLADDMLPDVDGVPSVELALLPDELPPAAGRATTSGSTAAAGRASATRRSTAT